MSGTGPAAVYGDFAPSMFDFDTRNHDFQQIFTDLHKYWIAYADVDGFRLDAVKHVSEDFLAYFSTHIRNYAKSVGKDNFYLVGEVAGPADWIGRRLGKMYHDTQNPDNHGTVPATLTDRIWDVRNTYLSHGKQNFPGMTAAYDFAFSGRSRDSLRNAQWLSAINAHFTDDYYETIASQQDARLNLSLLEIHDWPRFAEGAHKNNAGKSRLGLGYLATSQGIPITYYGQEQGFNGDCLFSRINAGAAYEQVTNLCSGHDHALYRQDMFMAGQFRLGSTVPEINDLAYIGPTQPNLSPDWKDDPFLNRDHSVFQTARRFNYIRRSCDALRLGGTFPRLGWNSSEGLLAFSRINGPQEILVVVNNSGSSITIPNITVDGGINAAAGQRYINLLNGYERGTVTKSGTSTYLSFGGAQIAGNSVKVFVHENNTTPWDSRIGAHMCTDNPIYNQDPNSVPTADAGEDITINPGETAFFDASASSDSDGSIVSYQWSNGIEGVSGSVTYYDSGTYEVTLIVTDDDGASESDTVIVNVQPNQAPVANAGHNITVAVNESVTLDASASTDSDGTIVGYQWSNNLGEQSTVTTQFSETGFYTFTVTVTDDDGASATDSIDIYVTAEPLDKNYDSMYMRGSHNGFDLSSPMMLVDHHLWEVEAAYEGLATDRFKFDVNGDWQINFGGGSSTSGTATLGGSDITVAGIEPGNYLVQFNDDTLTWTLTLIDTTPYPPVARAGNDQIVKVGDTVTLDASLSTDENDDIVNFSWNQGFGEGQIVSRSFSETGEYEVVLTVTDSQDFSDTDTVLISVVDNVSPVANAGVDTTVSINESFTLTGAASTDSDGAIVSYQWDHSSFGSPLTTEEITLSFSEVGEYTLSLTVTDDNGATHTDAVIVTVQESVENWQRTVILIYGRTDQGQDMFFRGGIDSTWSNANRGTQCESQTGGEHNQLCSIRIRHLNNLHQYTLPWRTGDEYLDWGKLTTARNGREANQTGTNSKGEMAEGTPAIWTTNNCTSGNVVSTDDLASSCNSNPNLYGGGFTTLNTYGDHYWMLDVEMNCDDTVDGWFEFKSFISNGPGWETSLNQTQFGGLNQPSYTSGNHFAACGMVNVFRRNQNNPVEIKPF